MKRATLILLSAFCLLLSACGTSSAAGPEKTVEAFLNALPVNFQIQLPRGLTQISRR